MAEPKATTKLIVPLTQPQPVAMRQAMLAAARAGADLVELRLDYLADTGDQALHLLLDKPPCPLLVTCRSSAEGGQFRGSDQQRVDLLTRSARIGGDWVDLELASLPKADALLNELAQASAAGRPVPGLILSAHNFQRRPADLMDILARMEAAPGAVNKVAFAATGPEDAWAAFDVLRASQKPAMALAMGETGVASRILARKFGAFGTFASLHPGAQSAPGQTTIEQLRTLYRWDSIGPDTRIYGVIGCPVGHSMSPAIHNAAFAADGLDAVYVPLRIEPGAENFARFIDAVLERPWVGLAGVSVTIPHKEHALARVGGENVDALAQAIGAVNTIVFTGQPAEPMKGYNTDYAAAIDALVSAMNCRREDLAGRQVAVLGAGGAARAIVAALAHYGADTVIYNRTADRAEQLAREFGSPRGRVCARSLDRLAHASADIYINCTPIGMFPKIDACPLPEGLPLPAETVVFDTIYNPVRTRLLERAAAAGCRTVSGLDMFVNQAVAQYELWTARPAPRDVMRSVVLRCLTGQN